MRPQAQFDRILSICKLFFSHCVQFSGKFASFWSHTHLFRHRDYCFFAFSKPAFHRERVPFLFYASFLVTRIFGVTFST